MSPDAVKAPSLEQEELRGISRTVAEIEWLLLVLVLLYYAFGGGEVDDKPAIVMGLLIYTGCVMGFRYAHFFKNESRWKVAVETWIMTAFVTWSLWHTGKLESPLLNSYLLVIITSALTLGKITTLLELILIATCFVLLGDYSSISEIISLRYVGGIFAQFAPFVLVAYISTMFSSDIRYGLNKAKLMSETDELTGILNRRGFAIVADRLFGQAVRYNRACTILMVDCDNLKRTNDDNGHKAGDALLVDLVKSIQGQLRYTDVLARQGGDEFIVLLPETPAAGALDVAERIRAAAEKILLHVDGKAIKTTVSIGCAAYPDEGRTLDALVAAADRSMYLAKSGGRNQVVRQAA
ncbi:MAG TPA: GGDEF domain-containing protein [Rhodocyclaceae bacterium]